MSRPHSDKLRRRLAGRRCSSQQGVQLFPLGWEAIQLICSGGFRPIGLSGLRLSDQVAAIQLARQAPSDRSPANNLEQRAQLNHGSGFSADTPLLATGWACARVRPAQLICISGGLNLSWPRPLVERVVNFRFRFVLHTFSRLRVRSAPSEGGWRKKLLHVTYLDWKSPDKGQSIM